jgi:predicted NAD/FAD-binding protein
MLWVIYDIFTKTSSFLTTSTTIISQVMVKHIAIIGAGAAGMSAAEALSGVHKVTVIERTNVCGGMATSEEIDSKKFGASYINDGVQGCSPQFANTFAVFDTLLGFKPADINLQVSFGRDIDEDFWSNVFPSNVIDKFVASPLAFIAFL